MKNVIIMGAAGRMGKTIIQCLREQRVNGLRLGGAIDLPDFPGVGDDVGLLAGSAEIGVPMSADLSSVAAQGDVIIDFSFHTATAGHAETISQWGIPWVIGTTGLEEEEIAKVESAARCIPIVMAPNMSFGVNLLFSLTRQAAQALKEKGYDIEIIERHHRLKVDSPSGTALGLGRAAAAGMGWDLDQVSIHGREGIIQGNRPEEQIGFHAIRGGDFVGDHTVLFAGDGESVELSHRATSRETFAVGALRAALWVIGRDPGIYSMQDVLEL